ncbi:HAD family hydrolase [Jeotgalibacillus campisalis]|uniref:L-2-haloalkanoic acid dehalogenase n=1 Tax=Jeotgalibacillus campisalis TaxID=220754 RepID=A0A0C2W8N6_9BACL|nr:HAD family hydrolase [Jeotgalibacillus campisalis]KIL52956.1 L-2-haloalkanoic acid dehalogenase [Jeotgalibacillus campisalis]
MEAILFDLDGTLLDRKSSVQVFLDKQYDRLYPWLKSMEKEAYISRFTELERNGYVWKDKVYQQLIEENEFSRCSSEMLLDDYIEHFQESCIPFEGLHTLLYALRSKGYKLALITNGREKMQMRSIQGLGIELFFDQILISAKEGCAKPDAEIFHRALNRLNVLPQNAVYVGDHIDNDIKAAKRAGLKTIWKKQPPIDDSHADAEIDQLSELIDLIESW